MPTLERPTTVAISKPKGPTSHDIVDAVRRITGERRVGHAGTLDPMAEGVLVIGIGREATKRLAEVVRGEKEYVAVLQLGATSTTDDAEGTITPYPSTKIQAPSTNESSPQQADGVSSPRRGALPWAPVRTGGDGTPPLRQRKRGRAAGYQPEGNDQTDASERHPERVRELREPVQVPTRIDVQRVLEQFIGRIKQVPPRYSAVKVRGKPAHRRVRRGEHVELAPREVEIHTIELLRYEWPEVTLRIACGPGTYIRALARDLGQALNVGGYLAALTRTRVGKYTIEQVMTVEEFKRVWNAAHTPPPPLTPPPGGRRRNRS